MRAGAARAALVVPGDAGPEFRSIEAIVAVPELENWPGAVRVTVPVFVAEVDEARQRLLACEQLLPPQ